MCGIAGIFAYHYAANPIDEAELLRIRDRMSARGPDGAGLWTGYAHRVGLAHRRLSIIDLSERGAQPFVSFDGLCAITFNGEIYNYKALRRELEQSGIRFRSDSDTEVLLELYRHEGVAMLPKLRGMYAFAIWDGRINKMLLARDPYGIKPLYYSDDGWTFRFASQVKALLCSQKISRDPEPAAVAGFYLWGSVPEPHTLYRQIRALPAGSSLWVDATGGTKPTGVNAIAETLHQARPDSVQSPAQNRDVIRQALLDSLRHHLVADVPGGLFLSAGIDSATILALMRELGDAPVRTLTLAFAEYQGTVQDEAPLAEELAHHYGAEHRTRFVSQQEFVGDLDAIFTAMDQPTIDGVNTWFVAKAAREAGLKVALSGLGGDELFGGYHSFSDIPRWVSRVRWPSAIPGLGALFRLMAPWLQPESLTPKFAGLLSYGGTYPGAYLLRRGLFLPWELPALIGKEMAVTGLRRLGLDAQLDRAMSPDPVNPRARITALESSLYMRNQLLRDTDWSSMAHSIEVRVPLVDIALLRGLAPLLCAHSPPNKAALAGSPARPLPAAIVNRSKRGFTTPIAGWLTQQPALDQWRRVPGLTTPHCPWARRWAYTVMSRYLAAA